MQILVNGDPHVTGTETYAEQVRATVEGGLGHLSRHLTRVEVHLNDDNAGKAGASDKRCMLEARLKGHEPVAVTNNAESMDLALDGAVRKLQKALGHLMGRLGDA